MLLFKPCLPCHSQLMNSNELHDLGTPSTVVHIGRCYKYRWRTEGWQLCGFRIFPDKLLSKTFRYSQKERTYKFAGTCPVSPTILTVPMPPIFSGILPVICPPQWSNKKNLYNRNSPQYELQQGKTIPTQLTTDQNTRSQHENHQRKKGNQGSVTQRGLPKTS